MLHLCSSPSKLIVTRKLLSYPGLKLILVLVEECQLLQKRRAKREQLRFVQFFDWQ